MNTEQKKPVLFNYYRSSASWRIRIALEWKGVQYDYVPINLLNKENFSEEYRKINPAQKLPAFTTKDGDLIAQSQSIIEYIEETYPERPMLPKCPVQKAYVREICQIIACDIHPLQNLGVLQRIGGDDQDKKMEWANTTVTLGFKALEARLEKLSGTYCVGDSITMADMFLVPMVGNANRWNVDMTQFPIISRIHKALSTLPEFIAASPQNQPDCPKGN
ncbi:maleylacetoacetate isomerase [Cokeromyces recurvatus]|uniref:maleylacetoacetate isomerase n=1 Tax=Cokeromyces recurvatus TaxID=90255 RepID=UPI00221EDECF|nr:maleylacetoacetate isomerase [Cokeromyces recurvatus]KAI7901944.1 maleylacetoacetate isomerase [Cokeromyces recurvatus]